MLAAFYDASKQRLVVMISTRWRKPWHRHKEQQIAGTKERESYPKSHSKMLFHHKDEEQMVRQFVVFTFKVKLIEQCYSTFFIWSVVPCELRKRKKNCSLLVLCRWRIMELWWSQRLSVQVLEGECQAAHMLTYAIDKMWAVLWEHRNGYYSGSQRGPAPWHFIWALKDM